MPNDWSLFFLLNLDSTMVIKIKTERDLHEVIDHKPFNKYVRKV